MCVRRKVVGNVLARVGAFGAVWLLTALAGTTPAEHPAKEPEPPAPTKRLLKRESFAEFAKSEKKMESLRKAIKKMRELDSKDPRSWVFQANIHWRPFFPTYVWDQAAKSENPAQQLFRDDPGFSPDLPVFNQCPHGNWWFLPWHRAYLYYFERILRWAAEDPTLTLPYWNYSNPGQRLLPLEFRQAKVGGKKDGPDNPLYLPESVTFTDEQGQPQVFLMRDGPLLRGETQLAESIVVLDVLKILPFTNADPLLPATGFASPRACDPTCFCGSGALERVPHNRLHTAIGGSFAMAGNARRIGFMGDPATAARDPIFWLHHCNIDRLWASWVHLQQGRKNPEDPEWLDYTFTLYDVDAQGKATPVEIAAKDLLATEQLGYEYDRLEPQPVAVAAAPPPLPAAAAPRTFRPLAATAPPKRHGVRPHGAEMPAEGIQLGTVKSRQVPVPLLQDVKPAQLRALATAKPEERQGVLILSLEGIDFGQLPGVDYDVYVNLPGAAKPGGRSPYHVGTMTFFGTRHSHDPSGRGRHAAPLSFKFIISPALGNLLAADETGLEGLRVTFVPSTGTEPVPNREKAPPGRADQAAVTIRQIRLLQVR